MKKIKVFNNQVLVVDEPAGVSIDILDQEKTKEIEITEQEYKDIEKQRDKIDVIINNRSK